jgi:hypothetical protein
MANEELSVSEVPRGLVVAVGRTDAKVVTKAGDFVTSQAAGEWGMGAHTGSRLAPTHQEIAKLAYSLYELRGRQDGQAIADWLRAEQELARHYA